MNLGNTFLRSIVYFVLVIAFLVLGFFVVTYAAGYTVDFRNRQVSKTGLISLTVKTPDTQIYVNDKIVGNSTMVLRTLSPGAYKIEIKKQNFHDWSKTVELHEQEAVTLSNIILFRQDPLFESYDSNVTVQGLAGLADLDSIDISGGEIYQNDDLVTRLSTDIFGASWYPDHKHISFSSDGMFRIIDVDGSNMIELFKKDSNSPVIFVSSGIFVIFEDKNQIFRAQIR